MVSLLTFGIIWFLFANNERKKIAKLVKECVNDIVLKLKNSKFDLLLISLIFHILWKKKQFQELREMSKVSDQGYEIHHVKYCR